MGGWEEYAKLFVGLLAIVNPIGIIPSFISFTSEHSEPERRRTAIRAAATVGLVLLTALLTGEAILTFFGITIASFRVGGGILVMLIAISMMHARLSGAQQTREEVQDAAERDSIAVVPLGIPLLAGPGAISTVVLYAHRSGDWGHYLILSLQIGLVAGLVWICLRAAPLIGSRLGRTGINVVTRIMGLIMAAIAVEIMANGLRQLFPGLA